MRSQLVRGCAALFLGLTTAPAMAAAQTPDTAVAAAGRIDTEPPVLRYGLSGPRVGVTIAPEGEALSQFGWHFERQASSGTRGPWFIVETVLLAGGVENSRFVPNGTLIFGIRLPSGYEFGIGPSATLGGTDFLHSSVVVAAGRSFRAGGIRIPVNVALATNREGQRWTIVTGWAIPD